MTVLTVRFLRVGQADSALLLDQEGRAFIVDLGRPEIVCRRLQELECFEIAGIVITHAHRDHAPTFLRFVRFVSDWADRGRIETVVVPRGMIERAFRRFREMKERRDPAAEILRHSLDTLEQLKGSIRIRQLTAQDDPIAFGRASLVPLTPSHFLVEKAHGLGTIGDNEWSLALRVDLGAFRALMLADVEGQGLSELLNAGEEVLRAAVVKIPHHGAWPSGTEPLEALLAHARPQLAVLSVGSTNRHGHVHPELFRCLLRLQVREALGTFACTEVTRTCCFTASQRGQMGRMGLEQPRPCAGEIVVEVDADGTFCTSTETNHPSMVDDVPMPACRGKADLV